MVVLPEVWPAEHIQMPLDSLDALGGALLKRT